MNKQDFNGWKKVYAFTLRQQMKSKVVKVMTAIFCIVAIAAPILIAEFSSDDRESADAKCAVSQIAVHMETEGKEDAAMTKSLEEWMENTAYFQDVEIMETDTDAQAVIQVEEAQGVFNITVTYEEALDATEEAAEDITAYLEDNWKQYLVYANGLSEEVLQAVNEPVDITYVSDEEEFDEQEYSVSTALILVIIMILAFGGEVIAAAVVTEKSSKVIDLLMTSIKPMAIVMGKILAMLSYIVGQVLAMVICFLGSSVVYYNMKSGSFAGFHMPEVVKNVVQRYLPGIAGRNLGIILLVAVLIVAGLIFFSVFAAIAGATVSRVEELAEGIKLYSVVLILCAYVGLFAGQIVKTDSIAMKIIMLCPFTTLFTTPTYALRGEVSAWIIIGAILLLVLAIYIALRFAATVYGALLYYKGSPMKWKQLLGIAKEQKEKQGEKGGDIHA
jgi:ABC-2 type transport system permease protein